MKVLILSDYSRLALDMNANLRLHGFNSALLTTQQVENEPGVINISIYKHRRLITLMDHARAFIYRKILLRSKGLYYQDISENSCYYGIERIKRRAPFVPDVVLILFDYRMVTGKTIADVHRWSGARIIWLMVDMKPMTGGCAYSGNCMKYTVDCGECPLIGNRLFRNYARKTLKKREELLRGIDLQVVAGSTYQQQQAQSSLLFRDRPVRKMFLPTDENVFRCDGKTRARKKLNLPEEGKIVLFGAQRFDEERKGYKFLLEALHLIGTLVAEKEITLLTVGNGVLPASIERMYRVKGLGWVDFQTLSCAYQAADVFVNPSVEDSGPIMVNQSLMCGTPVVAFKMGVSIDLVVDDMTGYLVELSDSKALSQGIMKILGLSFNERERLMNECLKAAERLGYRAFTENLRTLID